jgi:hypothetical protein
VLLRHLPPAAAAAARLAPGRPPACRLAAAACAPRHPPPARPAAALASEVSNRERNHLKEVRHVSCPVLRALWAKPRHLLSQLTGAVVGPPLDPPNPDLSLSMLRSSVDLYGRGPSSVSSSSARMPGMEGLELVTKRERQARRARAGQEPTSASQGTTMTAGA